MAQLGENGTHLYNLLMNRPEGVEGETFEVPYRYEDLGVAGTTMVSVSAIVDMLKDEWLDATILQIFSM